MTAPQAPQVEACPYCLNNHTAGATVCGFCEATRKRSGKWISPREARRNDVAHGVLLAFACVFALLMVLAMIGAVLGSLSSKPSSRFSSVCFEIKC